MSAPRGNTVRLRRPWFDVVEEAELRRLVWRAYALRGEPGYHDALVAIETWQVETAPERLARHYRPHRCTAAERATRNKLLIALLRATDPDKKEAAA